MFKYRGPKCRLCRRERQDLSLKTKPINNKCHLETAPGQHGRRSRASDKSLPLREKQKAKRIYNLTEKTFYRYFKTASKSRIATGQKLLELLETRLDSVVYRAGFALTLAHARQLVSHKCILVNDQVCNICSRAVKQGDVITLSPKIINNEYINRALLRNKNQVAANWLQVNAQDLSVTLDGEVQVDSTRKEFEEKYIIEFYAGR